MTTPVDYLNRARELLDFLEETQLPAVESAADAVIQALRHGGAVHAAAIGHGIEGDFIHRAGGLYAIRPLSWNFNVNYTGHAGAHKRPPPDDAMDLERETVRLAIGAAGLRAGDVVLVGSVSGRNVRPVELALRCREIGVKVIVLTSLTYTREVESVHPSGKRLCEAADVVLDLGTPYGDAAVDVAGYDTKRIPISGLAAVALGWMVWGRVMEKMAADGDPPSILISHNRAGGPEFNEASRKTFAERGY